MLNHVSCDLQNLWHVTLFFIACCLLVIYLQLTYLASSCRMSNAPVMLSCMLVQLYL
jgi:hypothetical protein